MVEQGTIVNIVLALAGAVCAVIVSGVAFAFTISNRVTKQESKTTEQGKTIDYLVTAGADIKKQLTEQLISVSEIKKDINMMVKSLDKIAETLEGGTEKDNVLGSQDEQQKPVG